MNNNEISDIFTQSLKELRELDFDPYPQCMRLRIPNAREQLYSGLRHYLGDNVKWLPCYDEIAEWMSDNNGRGLMCLGPCGLGKTLIVQNILPVIIHGNYKRIVNVYSAHEMNDNIAEIVKKDLVMVDDIGTEPSVRFNFGERTTPFLRLCDAAEKRGMLLMITANLRTTHGVDMQGNVIPSIEDRYGDLVLSRLRSIVKIVEFKGKDMRGTSKPYMQ